MTTVKRLLKRILRWIILQYYYGCYGSGPPTYFPDLRHPRHRKPWRQPEVPDDFLRDPQ